MGSILFGLIFIRYWNPIIFVSFLLYAIGLRTGYKET